jgi:hypothetical protein
MGSLGPDTASKSAALTASDGEALKSKANGTNSLAIEESMGGKTKFAT